MADAGANVVGGPEYARLLARARSQAAAQQPESLSDGDDPFEDEDSRWSTETVDEDNPRDVYGDPSHRPGGEDVSVASDDGSEDGPLADDPPPLLDVHGRPIVEADDRTAAPPGAVPPGREPHETAEDAVQPPPVAARAGGVHAGAEEEAPQPPPPPVEAAPAAGLPLVAAPAAEFAVGAPGEVGPPPGEAAPAAISPGAVADAGVPVEAPGEVGLPSGEAAPVGGDPAAVAEGAVRPTPRGRSAVHHLLNDDNLVFLSLDLETGGENCGIIQLSAEIVRIKMQRGGQGPGKDSISSVQQGDGVYNAETNTGGTTFNEYVNPGDDAEWNEAACVHGLTSSSPCIQSAREIGQVW